MKLKRLSIFIIGFMLFTSVAIGAPKQDSENPDSTLDEPDEEGTILPLLLPPITDDGSSDQGSGPQTLETDKTNEGLRDQDSGSQTLESDKTNEGPSDQGSGPQTLETDKTNEGPSDQDSGSQIQGPCDNIHITLKELIKQGNDNYDKGFFKEAINKYDEAISLINECDSSSLPKGELANVYYDKGNALCALDKYEEAIKVYNLAIDMNPNFAEAWYNKGFALQQLGQELEANKACAKAKDLGYIGP